MRTLDDLRTEHHIVLEVLDRLERAVSMAERGTRVPDDVFTDVQEFFATFVDRCHHGKDEAEVFPRLKGGAYAALAQRLEKEHGTGRKLAGAYAEAVGDYLSQLIGLRRRARAKVFNPRPARTSQGTS